MVRGRRMRAVAAAAGVLLLAALALLPDALPAAGARQGSCQDTSGIETVAQLDAFVQDALDTPEWQGGDVGASVELQDGRHLFVFADTLRTTFFGGQRLVRNSMLVVDSRCARAVLPAGHGPVIPDRDGTVGYWPMSVVRLGGHRYDLIGVTAERVRGTGVLADGIFAFEVLGASAAVFLVPRGGSPQLLAAEDFGPDDVDTSRPAWGAATATAGGWVYLYGTARPWVDAPGFSLQVARARPADFLDQDRWQYWNGRDWVADPDAAAELIGAADGGVSQSLSVFEDGGRWYAVSKRHEVLGTDLTIWTAPAPTGPFVASSVVAHIPSDPFTGTVRYMPLAHPGLLPVPGSIVVSYSENNLNSRVIWKDPQQYRPRFLRMPLPG